MRITSIIAFILVIIGAIVWLTVGLFSFNPVAFLLGAGVIPRIIYVLVGLAGLWVLFFTLMYKPFKRV
ncbi:MAG: DUF378 domain-containing protein [Clostridia bacterium]|nr:DUF378 domain-containing protein [Clostridia bacterium]